MVSAHELNELKNILSSIRYCLVVCDNKKEQKQKINEINNIIMYKINGISSQTKLTSLGVFFIFIFINKKALSYI